MRDFVAQAGGRRALLAGALASACVLAALAASQGMGQDRSTAESSRSTAGQSAAGFGFAPDLPGHIDISGPGSASAAAINRSGLRKRLNELVGRVGSATGVWVGDLSKARNKTLYGHKAGKRRILASNQKLFTTATALDRFGPDSRVTTTVFRQGAITDGKLDGALYLVGAGDPALSTRRFAAQRGLLQTSIRTLAKRVRKAGIRRVTGPLRADDSVFDRRRGVPAGNFEFSTDIGGRLSGLAYNGAQSSKGPAREAAVGLRKALRKEGVKVRGGIELGVAPKSVRKREPVAAIRSDALSRVVAATNKPSNNFYAEMLLKRIWAKPGRQGTTAGGAKAVQRFARRQGSGVHAVDGSGLTRSNQASPLEVGRLLTSMRKHKATEAFEASLAIAGQDGTLGGRMRGTRAQGRCRAKTGTLTGVSALSGYCDSGDDVVAFSILMSGTELNKARRVQDRMAVAIARYRG